MPLFVFWIQATERRRQSASGKVGEEINPNVRGVDQVHDGEARRDSRIERSAGNPAQRKRHGHDREPDGQTVMGLNLDYMAGKRLSHLHLRRGSHCRIVVKTPNFRKSGHWHPHLRGLPPKTGLSPSIKPGTFLRPVHPNHELPGSGNAGPADLHFHDARGKVHSVSTSKQRKEPCYDRSEKT